MDVRPRAPLPVALFVTVLVIAACGLVYELVAGALASYLLGDSVLQFSTVIGTYLFAMGLGSWLSRWVQRGLLTRFVTIELLVAVVGGYSATLLFLAFAYTDAFRLALYLLVLAVGVLVGLEIPLLMRILRGRLEFKDVVADVLAFDYLGALGASLLFPIVLVPRLGLVRAALAFGVVNALVAVWSTHLFRRELGSVRALRLACAGVLVLLGVGLWRAEDFTRLAEENLYADDVIFARDTRYQRVVLTAWKDDLRLFLNGHLQFSSRDEYRYHEALVHPGLAALPGARRVLVLGGGDGLAVREILKHPSVREVVLVDLDGEVTRLFRTHPRLAALNRGALADPRVRVVTADAFRWLDAHDAERFDFAVVDFPDPSNYAVGKLYTVSFYELLARHLSRDGLLVVQSTSPLFAPGTYWAIVETLKAARLGVWPYHLYVPSFGEWGFVLAGGGRPYRMPSTLPNGLRYLTARELPGLFTFAPDMAARPAQPNRLHDQSLVRTYDAEWGRINR